MNTSQLPVRTRRDDASFQDAMAAHLRQSPAFFVSAAAHLVLMLLLWILAPAERDEHQAPQVTLQHAEEREVVQQTPPDEPEVEPEVEPVVTPVQDTVLVDRASDSDQLADFDSVDPSTESAMQSDQWSTAVGLHGGAAGPYSKRGTGGEGGPGGRATPPSVRRGLQWLAAHQDDDGRWDADGFMKHDDPALATCDGPGNAVHDVGCTALALLAFLGENNTTKSGVYRENVRRGVSWLRKQQDPETGLFGARLSHDFVYDHAIAAYAMCEAYGLSRSKVLEKPAQRGLDYLESHRNAYSVWRYQPQDQDNDISVTGWAIMAYEAGRFFGLQVNRTALDNAEVFLEQVSDASGRHGYQLAGQPSSRKPGAHGVRFPAAKSNALTAVGLFCRFFLGQDPDERPVMRAAARLLAQSPPSWNEASGEIDHYGWYYATYALFQMGGPAWRSWRRAIEAAVPGNQHQDRTAANLYGSWDPVGAWGEDGGRVYATAILTLTMQASYRYTPLVR